MHRGKARKQWTPTRGSHLFVTLRAGADPRALADPLSKIKARCSLLFGESVDWITEETRRYENRLSCKMLDLTRDYRVHVSPARMRDAAESLRAIGEVGSAHMMPAVALPTNVCKRLRVRNAAPKIPADDYTSRQGYLRPAAAGGVDAEHAWAVDSSGGRGAKVQILHIEGAWNLKHEDLLKNQGGVLFGTPVKDHCIRQHGTAALGILGGDAGSSGVTGICPEAIVRTAVVAWDVNPDEMAWPQAIAKALVNLDPGDIILIEFQHPGPTAPEAFMFNEKRLGFIPPEWWPTGFTAIKDATTKGVIVVEAAGNGKVDLNTDALDGGDEGFAEISSGEWVNPFRRSSPASDSGAILVGAGSPPEEPHGPGVELSEARQKAFGPERSRMEFSNYGTAVDVQAWGAEVTTTGFGSLQGGKKGKNKELHWYTDQFGGTSSASTIVAGVLACLQGILKARKKSPLTPAQARWLLRETGWPQTAARNRPTSQRIGNRPDLKQLVEALDALPQI